MKQQNKDKLYNKRRNEMNTFVVPFDLEDSLTDVPIPIISLESLTKEEIISKAIKFHSQGDIANAAKYYQHFLNKGYTDQHVYSNFGVICQQLGQIDKSIGLYRKSISLYPNEPEPYSNLGNILRGIGRLREAESSIKKAIQINPEYADAYINLGKVYIQMGKLVDAQISTQKAIKLNPGFANAYSNLGGILKELGKLDEAESYIRKALEISPNSKLFQSNMISLLTIYNPQRNNSHEIIRVNNKFREIKMNLTGEDFITDKQIKHFYHEGLKIYRKHKLDLETHLSQIYKSGATKLNCKRHKFVFNQRKVIPEFCFGCYKVQTETNSIIDLIKLFLVFNAIKLSNNNPRKCMIELRPNIKGFYKGLIYCIGLEEANNVCRQVDVQIKKSISTNLSSKVKRGCSEYSIEYPLYKEINQSGEQQMNYNKEWKKIEDEIDKENKDWSKGFTSVEGFNLNNFLIIRNWIAYAQKIGDQSVNMITDEQMTEPKIFRHLNRVYNSAINST